jgi:hypothetical protein
MPSGWYGLICAICFEGLTPEQCFVDEHSDRWDVHPGDCAVQAGLVDAGHILGTEPPDQGGSDRK